MASRLAIVLSGALSMPSCGAGIRVQCVAIHATRWHRIDGADFQKVKERLGGHSERTSQPPSL